MPRVRQRMQGNRLFRRVGEGNVETETLTALNGQKVFEQVKIGGKIEGCVNRWFENGRKEKEEWYIGGLKEGWQKEWNSEEVLVHQYSMQQNIRHGLEEFYFLDGSLSKSIIWKNGKKRSETEWYENGQLKFTCIYSLLGRVSYLVVYDIEGRLLYKIPYCPKK